MCERERERERAQRERERAQREREREYREREREITEREREREMFVFPPARPAKDGRLYQETTCRAVYRVGGVVLSKKGRPLIAFLSMYYIYGYITLSIHRIQDPQAAKEKNCANSTATPLLTVCSYLPLCLIPLSNSVTGLVSPWSRNSITPIEKAPRAPLFLGGPILQILRLLLRKSIQYFLRR